MAITKAEIVVVLNSRLKRAETETTIAEEMRSALWDLSRIAAWPDLHHYATEVVTSGTQYASYPTDFRLLDRLVINDGTYDYEPLGRMNFDEWLLYRDQESSSNYDQPEFYSQRAKKFYLQPIPDASYTVKTWFWRYQPDSDTLLFSDQFREAIYNATMKKYLESKGLEKSVRYDQISNIYDRELGILLPEADGDPTIVPFRDI